MGQSDTEEQPIDHKDLNNLESGQDDREIVSEESDIDSDTLEELRMLQGFAAQSRLDSDDDSAADDQDLLLFCHYCMKRASDLELKRCSACKVVRYCSRERQVAHWLTHKVACKSLHAVKPKNC